VGWPIILIGGGFLFGFLTGRWWALAAPAALGFWAGLTFTDLEVPAVWIGLAFAGMGALGVLIGLVARRLALQAFR
jgi:hypothetical protein